MSQVNITNLTFAYPGSFNNIFENVNISFDTDWKIGFVGRNGRGKTTFMNILLENLEYSGKISKSVNFDYFPYNITDKTLPAIEFVYEIDPNLELWEVYKKMNQLSLKEDAMYQPFNTLSNGEQTKLLLAILFSKENNFLLIDEPTNHLDIESRESVSNFLKNQKGFMVISHDREFLDNVVDHIISINRANIDIVKGNFSSWYQNKINTDNLELQQNEKLKGEIDRLKESAMRTKEWAHKVEKTKNGVRVSGVKPDKGAIGHKAAKMMQRSKSIENRKLKAADEKSKLLKNIEKSDAINIDGLNLTSEKALVEFNDVSISYNNRTISKNINFKIFSGDKIAICGKNGSGKSSILKLILGNDICYTGNIFKNSRLTISYVSQTHNHLSGNLTDYANKNKIDPTDLFTMLRKLGFDRVQFEKDISDFSEGQKKKVLIATSLCQKANLYIWDEPLNYIDLLSRIQIENMLKDSDITLIFVDHDKTFINNIASKILYLN